MKRLIVATSNQHKLVEMRELLQDLDFEILGLKDINFFDDIEENGSTFVENAIIKAQTVSLKCNDLVMSDDSGIEIDALDKQPGIHSARYLGHDTPYDIKNQMILERLKDENNRSARFVCAIALCKAGEVLFKTCETIEGEIAKEPLGINGFGYDPIFYYPELKKGTAEMTMEEKNEVSHRGKAMRNLITFLNSYDK